MPCLPDKLNLTRRFDGRVKLTDGQREEICERYKSGNWSQRQLAGYFGVSRRLIVFVLHPEREQKQKEAVKREKRWLKYYDKDKNTAYMQKHRAKKRAVFGLPKQKHPTMVAQSIRERMAELKKEGY